MTAANFEASSGSPITPVEARKTSDGLHPTAAAVMSAVSRVASRPDLPVNALALPELTTSARALPPLRWARHQSTGADGHFERVNTPATVVPRSSSASTTSVRPGYRMPAAAVASLTPSTGGRMGKCGGASGEIALSAMAPASSHDRPGHRKSPGPGAFGLRAPGDEKSGKLTGTTATRKRRQLSSFSARLACRGARSWRSGAASRHTRFAPCERDRSRSGP